MLLVLLARLLDLYTLVVLASVVLSWIQLSPHHPIARFVHTLTEPLLEPIRRVLPSFGGFDFSPMVLLFGVQLVRRLLVASI